MRRIIENIWLFLISSALRFICKPAVIFQPKVEGKNARLLKKDRIDFFNRS
jgi:hypothetical protein